MANTYKFKPASEHGPNAKRKKVLAAVAQEIGTCEDDDIIVDAMNICDIIESHNDQQKQPTSSKAIYALGETIKNTLLEINELRERNRERRHKELLKILTKIVHDNNVTSKCDPSNKGKTFDEPLISNQRNVKHHAGEKEQNVSEQFIIDEKPTEAIADEEFYNSNSNSNLTNANSAAETVLSPLTPIIKPLKNVNSVVVINKSQCDLVEMRDQMLLMQRKKMEDRVRKNGNFYKYKINTK